MKKRKVLKPIGVGSLSLVLAVLGSIFAFYSVKEGKIGYILLSKVGLSDYFFPLISIGIFIIAYLLGRKYRDHLFSKSGYVYSAAILIILIFIPVLGLLQYIANFIIG